MAKSQKASVITLGRFAIACSRMVLAVFWRMPIVRSATPFCQRPPTAQKVSFCRLVSHAISKALLAYTPLSARMDLTEMLNLLVNASNSALDSNVDLASFLL